eukprot:COSAG01_NODE_2248_length_8076_cov_919.568384_15_plen_71_part_00
MTLYCIWCHKPLSPTQLKYSGFSSHECNSLNLIEGGTWLTVSCPSQLSDANTHGSAADHATESTLSSCVW